MDNIMQTRLIEASQTARKCVHDANNALFVAKGFTQEIGYIIEGKEYLKPDFNKEDLANMLEKITANIDKIGNHLKALGKFAREDIFEITATQNDLKK